MALKTIRIAGGFALAATLAACGASPARLAIPDRPAPPALSVPPALAPVQVPAADRPANAVRPEPRAAEAKAPSDELVPVAEGLPGRGIPATELVPENSKPIGIAAAKPGRVKALDWSPIYSDSRVYGRLGNTYLDLSYDDSDGWYSGSMDGRQVDVRNDGWNLKGYIGYNQVSLGWSGSWFWSYLTGNFAGQSESLTYSGRNIKGRASGVNFNVTASSDGRSMTGTYDYKRVSIATYGSRTYGYLGPRYVDLSRNWQGGVSGYIGWKTVNLNGDISVATVVRRLPLLAADSWLVLSVLGDYFD